MSKKRNKFKDSFAAFKEAWKDDENGLDEDFFEDEYQDDEERDNWKDGISIKNLKIVGGAILIGAVLIGGGYALSSCHKDEEKDENHENTYTTEMTTEEQTEATTTEEKDNHGDFDDYGNVSSVINYSNINSDKKEVLSAVWSYISYYNTVIANRYTDGDSTAKLAISWDEAIAEYFAYNSDSANEEKIRNVFDGYNVSSEELNNAYSSGTKADKAAAHIVAEETNKTAMLTGTEETFYDKYERIVTKFNSCGDSEADYFLKQELTDEFYRELRSDFNITKDSSINDKYKVAIIPLVKAMDDMTKEIESDLKLSKKQKKAFYNKDVINTEISDIFDRISNSADGTELDEEFTYAEIREFAIKELESQNAYDIDNRDVTNYSKYQESLLQEVEVTEEKEEVYTPVEPSNKSANYDTTNITDETTTELDDDDKSDVIPDWMLNEEVQDTNIIDNDTESSNIEVDATTEEPFIDEDIPDVEKDTPDYSFNSKIINSSISSIKKEQFQAYCDMVATAIVENMAKESAKNIEKVIVKSL